jgi:hypothetical protein
MREHRWISPRIGDGLVVAVVLALSVASIALVVEGGSSRAAAQPPAKLEATIFSYDGKDFTRVRTTMMTEEGKSAVNTKLAHDTPAYEALIHNHSYTGDAKVFGREYEANYAPLTGEDGHLTGALFVAVAK